MKVEISIHQINKIQYNLMNKNNKIIHQLVIGEYHHK